MQSITHGNISSQTAPTKWVLLPTDDNTRFKRLVEGLADSRSYVPSQDAACL